MQRTLKRESKVLEIAERKTIATDRCGLRHDPSLVGFRKKPKNGGRIVFFFSFFHFFFLPFSFFVSKGGRCLDWRGLGQHRFGGRQTTAVEVGPPRRSRGGSIGSRRGGGDFFFFFSLLGPTVFRVTGSGGFDLGISVVPKPSCGGPR